MLVKLTVAVNFIDILWAHFLWNFFCHSQNVTRKRCRNNVRTKNLYVKCWWNLLQVGQRRQHPRGRKTKVRLEHSRKIWSNSYSLKKFECFRDFNVSSEADSNWTWEAKKVRRIDGRKRKKVDSELRYRDGRFCRSISLWNNERSFHFQSRTTNCRHGDGHDKFRKFFPSSSPLLLFILHVLSFSFLPMSLFSL
jgi:hypothetical protein